MQGPAQKLHLPQPPVSQRRLLKQPPWLTWFEPVAHIIAVLPHLELATFEPALHLWNAPISGGAILEEAFQSQNIDTLDLDPATPYVATILRA